MNAMLDPRIVAARTHLPEDFGHGVGASPDRITPSAHGSRIKVVIVTATAFHDKR
jgi:hypothetical protein